MKQTATATAAPEIWLYWLQALALLLRGDGTQSFLSPKAVSDACEDLLPMLEHGATAQSYPHIPCSPMCQSAQKRHRAQLLAQAVLHVLDLCLFSSAVMLVHTGQGHAALWLLCTVYRLACLPQSRARHGMNSPPELAFTGKRSSLDCTREPFIAAIRSPARYRLALGRGLKFQGP